MKKWRRREKVHYKRKGGGMEEKRKEGSRRIGKMYKEKKNRRI